MSNKKINSLHELGIFHDWQQKDLAAACSHHWQPIAEKRRELLMQYGGFEQAPINVQKEIVKMENDYQAEWGSKGRIQAALDKQQKADRISMTLRLSRERNKEHDKDREH